MPQGWLVYFEPEAFGALPISQQLGFGECAHAFLCETEGFFHARASVKKTDGGFSSPFLERALRIQGAHQCCR
jgi:hypothetical protein